MQESNAKTFHYLPEVPEWGVPWYLLTEDQTYHFMAAFFVSGTHSSQPRGHSGTQSQSSEADVELELQQGEFRFYSDDGSKITQLQRFVYPFLTTSDLATLAPHLEQMLGNVKAIISAAYPTAQVEFCGVVAKTTDGQKALELQEWEDSYEEWEEVEEIVETTETVSARVGTKAVMLH